MRRLSIIALALFVVMLFTQGCSRQSTQGMMEIKGSDTMVNLGQAWAERYIEEHPETNISVNGGGSGTGIAALINGNTDIAQASRDMKEAEIEQARKNGMDPKEFVVAKDGVSVIVNPSNPVGKLTVEQLSDIYTGKVTNWKEVGGNDLKIVVLSRDKSSGTHEFFKEHIVRQGNSKGTEEYAKTAPMLPSSQAIADEVANNPATIGYVGMGYADKNKHKPVAVAADADSEYVEPTEENVINGSYPIARPLHFYTPGEPEGMVKDYIDFVMSDEGQKIVLEQEFVPVKDIQ